MTSTNKISTRRQFATFLERNGVCCRLIGPCAPSGKDHTDIDVVVAPEDWSSIPRLVGDFCRDRHLRVLLMDQPERGAYYFVVGSVDEEKGLRIQRLYIFNNLYIGARKYARASSFMATGRSDLLALEFYLLRGVESLGLDNRSCIYLRELWMLHPHAARAALLRYWPGDEVSFLARTLFAEDWDGLRASLPRLRNTLRRSSRISWDAVAHKSRRRLSRLIRPRGFVVVILGPDGSGKSTVIDRLRSDFSHIFEQTERLHFRPWVMSRRNDVGKVNHPHAKPARGLWRSLLKLVYYVTDNVLGYVVRVRPAVAKAGFVVFDRYFHDVMIDPKRYRYGGPSWAVSWLSKLVPEPNLYLLLDAPVAVIQSRRQEVATQEMMRQRDAYHDLASRLVGAAVIDASRDQASVTRDAEALILDNIEAEARARLREAIEDADGNRSLYHTDEEND